MAGVVPLVLPSPVGSTGRGPAGAPESRGLVGLLLLRTFPESTSFLIPWLTFASPVNSFHSHPLQSFKKKFIFLPFSRGFAKVCCCLFIVAFVTSAALLILHSGLPGRHSPVDFAN